MALNKKGYAYWIEIILSVVIVMIIFQGYLESNQTVFQYKEVEDLKSSSWHVMNNLNTLGHLNTSNLSELQSYVASSFPATTGTDMDYYNDTSCFPVDNGTKGTATTHCAWINISSNNDVTSALYTKLDKNNDPESIRLHIWRKL